MLAVVHNEVMQAIEIELDLKGIDLLIETLQGLKEAGDHCHIRPSNGLSAVSLYYGDRAFGQLILSLVADDISQEEIDAAAAAHRQSS